MTGSRSEFDDDQRDLFAAAAADARDAEREADKAADTLEALLDPPDEPPAPAGRVFIIYDQTLSQFVGGVLVKRPAAAVLKALTKAHPGHVFVVREVPTE
jgi:hypothetical protein